MKTTVLFFSMFFLSSLAFGQDDQRVENLLGAPSFEVEPGSTKWQKQQMETHSFFVNGDKGDVEKALENYFKDKYKIEFSKMKGMNAAEGVVLNDVINETGTLAFKVDGENGGSRVSVLMDLGGKALNHKEHPQASASLRALLRGFNKEFTMEEYDNVIGNQEKVLGKEEKSYEKLVKEGEKIVSNTDKNTKEIADSEQEIKDLEAKIENLKKEIEQLKKDKENNLKEQERQKKAVEAQKAKVASLRSAKGKL